MQFNAETHLMRLLNTLRRYRHVIGYDAYHVTNISWRHKDKTFSQALQYLYKLIM